MSKVTWKGSTLLAPLPVVAVSCGNMDKANIITVAWTGIMCSNPAKTYVSIRPERYSHGIISDTRELCINLVPSALIKKTDWCGIRSGRDVDKFAKMSLTKEPCTQISCPQIAESPLSLECRVTDVLHLGSHDAFICDIVAVNADESIIDEKGKLRLDKAGLAAFSHGEYFALGKKIGKFGFSHNKRPKRP
ncbi:MAG: flavin reductase family protein [Clostridia bacterium]|nr:flavin reductase family protein [Clostridia bacterium]